MATNSIYDNAKENLFKESVFSVLKQMCFKMNKKIEPNYYGFDCFAKKGINDDVPTVVQINFMENRSNVFSKNEFELFITNILAAHKNLSRIKILIIVNKTISKNKLDKIITNEKRVHIEIWDGSYLSVLEKEYPLDFFTYSNDTKSIKKYLTKEKIAAKASLNVNLFKLDSEDKKITLVLGAGVSKDYGGLDLNELTQRMISSLPMSYIDNKEGVLDLVGKSTVSTLHFVKENIGKQYGSVLYECLYGHQKKSFKDENTTLFQVANLIERRNVDSVITYNYDNFLEEILSLKKIPYKYLYNRENYLSKELPIYHVHGFLPHDAIHIEDYIDSVVLSEDDFFNLYSNNYSWQVALQLEKFKDNICLFVGCSLKDTNLKRLLLMTKQRYKRHYAIMYKKDVSSMKDMLVINRYFELFNVEIIWVDEIADVCELLKGF